MSSSNGVEFLPSEVFSNLPTLRSCLIEAKIMDDCACTDKEGCDAFWADFEKDPIKHLNYVQNVFNQVNNPQEPVLTPLIKHKPYRHILRIFYSDGVTITNHYSPFEDDYTTVVERFFFGAFNQENCCESLNALHNYLDWVDFRIALSFESNRIKYAYKVRRPIALLKPPPDNIKGFSKDKTAKDDEEGGEPLDDELPSEEKKKADKNAIKYFGPKFGEYTATLISNTKVKTFFSTFQTMTYREQSQVMEYMFSLRGALYLAENKMPDESKEISAVLARAHAKRDARKLSALIGFSAIALVRQPVDVAKKSCFKFFYWAPTSGSYIYARNSSVANGGLHVCVSHKSAIIPNVFAELTLWDAINAAGEQTIGNALVRTVDPSRIRDKMTLLRSCWHHLKLKRNKQINDSMVVVPCNESSPKDMEVKVVEENPMFPLSVYGSLPPHIRFIHYMSNTPDSSIKILQSDFGKVIDQRWVYQYMKEGHDTVYKHFSTMSPPLENSHVPYLANKVSEFINKTRLLPNWKYGFEPYVYYGSSYVALFRSLLQPGAPQIVVGTIGHLDNFASTMKYFFSVSRDKFGPEAALISKHSIDVAGYSLVRCKPYTQDMTDGTKFVSAGAEAPKVSALVESRPDVLHYLQPHTMRVSVFTPSGTSGGKVDVELPYDHYTVNPCQELLVHTFDELIFYWTPDIKLPDHYTKGYDYFAAPPPPGYIGGLFVKLIRNKDKDIDPDIFSNVLSSLLYSFQVLEEKSRMYWPRAPTTWWRDVSEAQRVIWDTFAERTPPWGDPFVLKEDLDPYVMGLNVLKPSIKIGTSLFDNMDSSAYSKDE